MIDGSRRLPRVGGDAGISGIISPEEAGRVLDSDVANGEIVRGSLCRTFSSDETTPGLVTLVNDLSRVLFVFGLARERKGVFGLAVGNLVDPEPFIGSSDQTRLMSLHVFDVVELRGKRILHIDDNNFPVSLAFVRRAMMPRTLTCLTWPTYPTCSPISQTSRGSLSPLALVSACD